MYGDGGGKAPSMPVPLVGAERVAKALVGWGRKAAEHGYAHRPASGQRRARAWSSTTPAAGSPGSPSLQIADGVVVAVRSVLNPDKLAHLAELVEPCLVFAGVRAVLYSGLRCSRPRRVGSFPASS